MHSKLCGVFDQPHSCYAIQTSICLPPGNAHTHTLTVTESQRNGTVLGSRSVYGLQANKQGSSAKGVVSINSDEQTVHSD